MLVRERRFGLAVILDRSIARSIDRSIARSLAHSLDRSIARSLVLVYVWLIEFTSTFGPSFGGLYLAIRNGERCTRGFRFRAVLVQLIALISYS